MSINCQTYLYMITIYGIAAPGWSVMNERVFVFQLIADLRKSDNDSASVYSARRPLVSGGRR